MVAVAQRVHRLPETAMVKGAQFAIARKALEQLLFKDRRIAFDPVKYRRRQHEKAAVDRAAIACGLFDKGRNPVALPVERAEAARRHYRRHGRSLAMGAVKSDRGGDMDIAETVAFLAGPARWINGQVLYANGGLA